MSLWWGVKRKTQRTHHYREPGGLHANGKKVTWGRPTSQPCNWQPRRPGWWTVLIRRLPCRALLTCRKSMTYLWGRGLKSAPPRHEPHSRLSHTVPPAGCLASRSPPLPGYHGAIWTAWRLRCANRPPASPVPAAASLAPAEGARWPAEMGALPDISNG
jgi:hypothetical protein